MVSVKDIAARCGVSVATVSKALNGYTDISEEKRNYIKEVAKEMGYFPNSAAIALKTNRTYNIGILFVDAAHSGLTHEHYARVLQGVKEEAESRGYDITFINNQIGGRAMTYTEHCRYRGVDGVVIACIDFDDSQVVELVNSDVPVVTIDHVFNNTTSVISDNVKGIQDLVQYVYDMGHRKIAFIHGADSSVSRDRLASFYRTLDSLRVTVPEEYVSECAYRDLATAARETERLLALKEPPTCILYPDDFTAIGGINVIKQKNLRIPEDISVVGYDGISYAKVTEPPITTLEQDSDALGRNAAMHLIQRIEKPKTALVERIVVGGHVLVGKSVKKIKNA
ncbi:MAG: LacI family DNA-binding transcriptional regulator [Lachnospiraceae bacterium]|nr:LacI family DNA-binding transcriptional regulator [Lachnospiraceae bacterium]